MTKQFKHTNFCLLIKRLVLVISLFSPFLGSAQTDQVKQKDSLRFEYKLNASLRLQTGRINQLLVPASLHTKLFNKTLELSLLGNYTYQKLFNNQMQDEKYARGILSFFPKNNIRPMVGFIYESSRLYQMKSRHSPGIGFGLTLKNTTNHKLKINAFASYDQTEFENIEGYATFRTNFIVFGKHVLVKDKLQFDYTLYYFQSVQDGTNYTFRFEPKLLFKLNKILSFTTNANYRYESIIDPTNKRNNLFMTVGLQIGNMR
jgi:hypothetical protein|tara:strand:- start:845 stop:1624 length:780 start_codon:yes stop_codon:yes gene_type:complete